MAAHHPISPLLGFLAAEAPTLLRAAVEEVTTVVEDSIVSLLTSEVDPAAEATHETSQPVTSQASPPIPEASNADPVGTGLLPATVFKHDGCCLAIEIEVPGVTESDLSITVKHSVLTVEANKLSVAGHRGPSTIIQKTRSTNLQRFVFDLPASVEENSITADLNNGLLLIQISTANNSPTDSFSVPLRSS